MIVGHLAEDQILDATAHRPWPLPEAPWVGRQTWRDLMFAHWRVSRDLLRQRVPSFLDIDTFEDEAWVGITPFHIIDSTARGIPAVPWLSSYTELNVRTYVTYKGVPGIFFFSLDADSTIAVAGATAAFHLPYFLAEMRCSEDGSSLNFRSRRITDQRAQFSAVYAPVGPPFEPQAGTLAYWLTERYCLYTMDASGHAYRVEIHHVPWSLQEAQATITANGMAEAAELELAAMPPVLHFARRQDTLIWLPHALR